MLVLGNAIVDHSGADRMAELMRVEPERMPATGADALSARQAIESGAE